MHQPLGARSVCRSQRDLRAIFKQFLFFEKASKEAEIMSQMPFFGTKAIVLGRWKPPPQANPSTPLGGSAAPTAEPAPALQELGVATAGGSSCLAMVRPQE